MKKAAKYTILAYMESYYKTQRRHSSLGYITPLAVVKAAQKQKDTLQN